MSKKVVIAGGSGFLGSALATALVKRGYEVVVLTRQATYMQDGIRFMEWDAANLGEWSNEVDGCYALVNFTGRSINAIYTQKVKAEILNSRIQSVKALNEAVSKSHQPPTVFIQASAIGIYGDTTQVCDETSPYGTGFLANVCQQWEQAFLAEESPHTRKVIFRIGFVLGRDGGALAPLQKLTRFRLGGTVGKGDQYISWIHIDDLVQLFLLAIENHDMSGVYNATAPNPVTNKSFMKELRSVMNKGWAPPAPTPIAWLGAYVFMRADPSLALEGTYAVPKRILELGYSFKFTELGTALKDLIP